MQHFGEIIALVVAMSWTVTALLSEVGVKRLGSLQMNVLRMVFALTFLSGTLFYMTGYLVPMNASAETWMWMALSGFAGFVVGDYFLFNSYVIIGSRFGQLFMTLSPIAAAFTAYILIGEKLTISSVIGIFLTIAGIMLSIFTKGGEDHRHLKLPLKGVLYGIGAGMGQGLGLTLSKVGMIHYEADVAECADSFKEAIPYAATFMRSIVGFVGFIVTLTLWKGWPKMMAGLHDRKGVTFALLASIFGPFVGVSLSLMSVQYADAGIAATIMALTPIMILLPSRFILKQKVTALEVVGAVISFVGVACFFL